MKINKQGASSIFLMLGMVSLAIGWSTNRTIFSWMAIAFIIISLALGGRWMRPRRK
jgi:hypothetical protein